LVVLLSGEGVEAGPLSYNRSCFFFKESFSPGSMIGILTICSFIHDKASIEQLKGLASLVRCGQLYVSVRRSPWLTAFANNGPGQKEQRSAKGFHPHERCQLGDTFSRWGKFSTCAPRGRASKKPSDGEILLAVSGFAMGYFGVACQILMFGELGMRKTKYRAVAAGSWDVHDSSARNFLSQLFLRRGSKELRHYANLCRLRVQ
jgi:hypothetical protein